MTTNGPLPALDLSDFRRRSYEIHQARQEAARDAEEHGIEEGEADFRYRRLKAQALAYYRTKEDMGVTEAEVMAEGSEKVTQAKLERHTAWVLRRAAEDRLQMLERNAASLRVEATMSEGLT
jgi:methylase of polypeptide subunit release factors